MKMEVLLVSLFPILGFIFGNYVSKKFILLITSISLILLSPEIISPFTYNIKWIDDFLLTFILSGVYAFFILKTKKKLIVSILISAGIFILLFFNIWVNAMAGSNETIKNWKQGSYEINYIESRGFSGRPLYYYELKQYKFLRIFEANLDKYELKEPLDTLCEIQFYDNIDSKYINFDRCAERINVP